MREEVNIWEQRFQFLCRTRPTAGSLRYSLHAPDAFDARWSVYDHTTRTTAGRGANGPAAVDCAIKNGPTGPEVNAALHKTERA